MIHISNFSPSWIRVNAFFYYRIISRDTIRGLGLRREKAWTLPAEFLYTFLWDLYSTNPGGVIHKVPVLPEVLHCRWCPLCHLCKLMRQPCNESWNTSLLLGPVLEDRPKRISRKHTHTHTTALLSCIVSCLKS